MGWRKTVLLCVLAFTICSSCRMAEVLAGNERAGTVDNLWSDVPPIAGAKKADLAIPLAARLLIRTMMQGKVNFIAFTSDRTARQVQDFYTNERMQAAGWTPAEQGCVGDTESRDGLGGTCLFTRKSAGKEEGLAIIVAEDPETSQTHIFYARIDVTPDPRNTTSDRAQKR